MNEVRESKFLFEKNYRPLYNPYIPIRVFYLITYSKEGIPNITIISFAKVKNGNIIIPNVALLKSIENIKENPEVSLVVPMIHEFEIKGNIFKKFLDKISYQIVSIPFSFLGRVKIKVLLAIYNIIKLFISKQKYVVKLSKNPCVYIIKGICEIKNSGNEFDSMKKFLEIVLPKDFELKDVLIIKPKEIKKQIWK